MAAGNLLTTFDYIFDHCFILRLYLFISFVLVLTTCIPTLTVANHVTLDKVAPKVNSLTRKGNKAKNKQEKTE